MTYRIRLRGSVLLVVMVFLLLLAIAGISAFRSSTTNLRTTNNMMVRQEAISAAQAAIETTISTPAFQAAPAASAPFTSIVNIDVDGDGANDYAVAVTPATTCSKVRQLLNNELPEAADAAPLKTEPWRKCDSSRGGLAAGSGSGSAGLIETDTPATAQTEKSFCVETLWNVQATVTDSRTGTAVEVNQGAAVPYSIGESKDRCERAN